MKKQLLNIGLLLMLGFAFTACQKEKIPAPLEVSYISRDDWAPDVRQSINQFMRTYAHAPNAYAVFDFDNTCSIFDVEEQLEIHQLKTMAFALDPEDFGEMLATGLDTNADRMGDWIHDICAAYGKLYKSYGPFSAQGVKESVQQQLQQDPQWQEFAAKMACMYDAVAKAKGNDFAYEWILYWFSGMSEKEVYDLASAAYRKYGKVQTSFENWQSPSSIASRMGSCSHTHTLGVQVTENIRELWQTLRQNGIDVWVCSASGLQQVMAAIDCFGLHTYCTGVLGMTLTLRNGVYTPRYDLKTGHGYTAQAGGKWVADNMPTRAVTSGKGKVTAIENVLKPKYANNGPLAGFMDASGDFNFCTEFSSLKMVVCFNRADRKPTDGGGLIAELAVYQRDTLGLDLPMANAIWETFYLLQGRDENGLRTFRPYSSSITAKGEEKLFANEQNYKQLAYFKAHNLRTSDILNRFCIKTPAEKSELGFAYGWLDTYAGYHSIN